MSLTSPLYDGSGNPTTFSTYATSQAGPSDPTNVNLSGAGATFDSEDRLVGLSSSSPAVAFSALYDGDGLRSQKTVGSKTTYYLYDGGTLLEEMTASGTTPTLTEMYLSGADGVRARWDPSNFETDFYAYDPEGSLVQFQPSEDANPTQRTLVYDGWGDLTGDILYVQGTEQAPFGGQGFGGQYGYYQDPETGLYQLGARYYDAGKGRFVNRDPIGYGGGANLYGFCGNNPITNSDPSGMDADPPEKEPGKTGSFFDLFKSQDQVDAENEAKAIGEANREAEQLRFEELEEELAETRAKLNESLAKHSPMIMIRGLPGEVYTNPEGYANARTQELLDAFPENTTGYTTMAVGILEDPKTGDRQVVIGTNDRNGYLRPGVGSTLNPDEVVARGPRGSHAEADIIAYALGKGLRVITVGATRPVCSECVKRIVNEAGGTTATARKLYR